MSTKNEIKFAEIMKCKPEAVKARLKALGLHAVCGRCAGCGHYSFNMQDGTRCYGCNGSGTAVPAFTKAKGEAVAAAIEAGGLEAYFADLAAKKAAKAAMPALEAEAREVYSVIGNAYTLAWQQQAITADLSAFQTAANKLFYGDRHRGGEALGILGTIDHAKQGKIDLVIAVETIRNLTADLHNLVADFQASK